MRSPDVNPWNKPCAVTFPPIRGRLRLQDQRWYPLRSACQLGGSSEITFDPHGRKEVILEILEYP